MISRRRLYTYFPALLAAAAVSPLGACNTTKIDAAYNQVFDVARKIEEAMIQFAKKTKADMDAAAKMLAIYIIPTCKVVRLVNAFVGQLVKRGLVNDTNPKVASAIADFGVFANSGLVTQVAGAASLSDVTADPVALAFNILDALVTIKAVIPDARPTTAVAAS